MPGPLSGIKVFEVSQIIAGPVCGQNLADLGGLIGRGSSEMVPAPPESETEDDGSN